MLLSLKFNKTFWPIILGSVAAIATAGIPLNGFAQTNQSDITGPNLSDITGPNLSDVTGPNQSDNTGLLGEEIFRTADGDFVSLSEFFQDFFDTYGDEFDLDPDASLADNLRRVSQVCNDQTGSIRRFSRTPGTGIQPVSQACTEFSQLIMLAKQSLDRYKQARQNTSPADRRLW